MSVYILTFAYIPWFECQSSWKLVLPFIILNNTYSLLTCSPQVYVHVKGLHNNEAFCFKCCGFRVTRPVRRIKNLFGSTNLLGEKWWFKYHPVDALLLGMGIWFLLSVLENHFLTDGVWLSICKSSGAGNESTSNWGNGTSNRDEAIYPHQLSSSDFAWYLTRLRCGRSFFIPLFNHTGKIGYCCMHCKEYWS